MLADGVVNVAASKIQVSAGAMGAVRFSSPLTKADAKSVDDIKSFTLHYGATVESYAEMTAQQLLDSFAGAGLSPEARQKAQSLMKSVSADTAAMFGPTGYSPLSDRGSALAAANQHAGYVAGEIGRKFAPVSQKAILEHVMAAMDGKNPSIADLAEKLAFGVRPDDKADVKGFVNDPNNSWMFGAYGFGKSDIALNMPGVIAGKATFDFATALVGDADKARTMVGDTLKLPAEVVEIALRGPQGVKDAIAAGGDVLKNAEEAGKLSTEQLAVLQFSARAAQAGWLTSKLGQGIVEAHHSDPKRAEKGVARFGPKNDLITDFNSLAEKKGWKEVAKYIDQIKNSATLLRRDELNIREMTNAADIRPIADATFGKRDVRIATAGYSAAPNGYEAPTRAFMDALAAKLGDRVGFVTSPTADKGSIDAITTMARQAAKAPVLNVTAEGRVRYIKPEGFPAEIDKAAYTANPKYVFGSAEEYSKATAEASNVFVAAGGRDATIGDFINAIKHGNKVVLLDNPELAGAAAFDKRGRPDNAVAFLVKVLKDGKLPADLTADQEKVLLNKGLTAQFLTDNAAKLKSLVTTVSLGGGVDAAAAAAAKAIGGFG